MTYINFKTADGVETADEFSTRLEARKMIKEYYLADWYNSYYLSNRCTKDWSSK